MINLIEIPIEELKECIEIAFEGDNDLIAKYHIKNSSFDECVENTFEAIAEMCRLQNTNCYKTVFYNEVIGYVVIVNLEIKLLYSFGINVEYRYALILKEWMRSIKVMVGEKFFATLWKKNSRAIKFLEKQNMKVVKEEKEFLTLATK